jgi:multiple sugar transport system substrate-binding protein
MSKWFSIIVALTLLAGIALVACAPAPTPAPQIVKETVQVPVKETVQVTVKETVQVPVKETVQVQVTVAAPTAAKKQVVELWSTDNEEQRVVVYEKVAANFMAKNPDVDVRIVPIDEATTSQRIATARGANRLPAVARVGIERVSPFLADGILDVDAATKVIKDLGEDTFPKGVLDLVRTADGKYAAVPFDGWIQALWYRSDEFKKLGLAAPIKWDDIQKACEALKGKEGNLYGLTLGTDPGQNYGAQVFEQIAMSNGAFPFDKNKKIVMNSPEMIEALTFYTGLQTCSAPGPNYWKQAREFYITGQSPMIWYSTYVMDDLVGLQQGVEPTVKDLGTLTGFAPSMTGKRGGSATYGQLVVMAIMKGNSTDGAVRLLKSMLTGQDYIDVLFLSPNGKIPVRTTAVADWSKHPIFQRYPKDVIDTVVNGYNAMQRWLYAPQMGPVERAVIGDMEGRLIVPQAVSNVVEGKMTVPQAADWLQARTEELYKTRQAEQK